MFKPFAIALLAPVAALQAQIPTPWPVLQQWPTVGAVVRYQTWPVDTGWVVYLKNTGTVTLFFDPTFSGLPAATPKYRRVQLDPKGITVLFLPSQPTSIQLLSVRAGEMDEGDYLK